MKLYRLVMFNRETRQESELQKLHPMNYIAAFNVADTLRTENHKCIIHPYMVGSVTGVMTNQIRVEIAHEFRSTLIGHYEGEEKPEMLSNKEFLDLYHEYVNDYLTIKVFAEQKGFSEQHAHHIRCCGKALDELIPTSR